MPPRPTIPPDDLYARLEVPADASFEVIEVAWRALLKLHHPDVAGLDGLERAKRINVAHDWLSDPELRERYDRERHPRRHARHTGHFAGGPPPHGRPGSAGAAGAAARAHPRPRDPAAALAAFVERVGRLSRDELDRLSVAEGPPLAFGASIRRFLSPDRVAAVKQAEAAVAARLSPAEWASASLRDAVLSAAHEIVLGDFLDEHLEEPIRGRVRERLTRGWDAAVGQPRYGPNSAAVERLLRRAAVLTEDEARRLVAAAGPLRAGDEPWPRGLDPDEDEVFRVSALLAARDAAASPVLARLDRQAAARVRRVLRRTAHVTVLRHAFTGAEFAELIRPWQAVTGDPGTGRAGERGPDPSVHRRS
jgi:curved DNA-binding protein CbpA